MSKTVKAIEYGTQRADGSRDYVVMVAHAGRRDRTGGKVHVATLTVWASGNVTIGATHCSNRGDLRGQVVTDRDFAAVSCKRCGASHDAAERRNAAAIDLAIGGAQ